MVSFIKVGMVNIAKNWWAACQGFSTRNEPLDV